MLSFPLGLAQAGIMSLFRSCCGCFRSSNRQAVLCQVRTENPLYGMPVWLVGLHRLLMSEASLSPPLSGTVLFRAEFKWSESHFISPCVRWFELEGLGCACTGVTFILSKFISTLPWLDAVTALAVLYEGSLLGKGAYTAVCTWLSCPVTVFLTVTFAPGGPSGNNER